MAKPSRAPAGPGHAIHLGVDMGGSGTRWVALDGRGAELARGTAPGASGLVDDPAVRAGFEAALAAVRGALPGPAGSAVLGITGAGVPADPRLAEMAAAILGPAPERVACVSDAVLAWQAVFDGGPGHLVSAGTGAVGVSLDAAGRATVIGGWGILIDDAGSAAWIALRALAAVCRRIDERGAPERAERLAATLFAAMGGDDREAVRRVVYGAARGQIGLLAVPVAAAARKGDAEALDILEQAGRELARLGRVLLDRCGRAPVAFIGGALALHPAIRGEVEAGLPGEALLFPSVDAAAHAARMAHRRWGA